MIATANADGSLKITAVGDLDIVLTRTFAAPRQLVWDAHTKPELLRRWFGVFDGITFEECDIDLRVGGTYKYVWRQPGEQGDVHIVGVFREIVAPARFVYTERWKAPFTTETDAVNTHAFEERDGRTFMTLTTRYANVESRDMALASGMEQGLLPSYENLDALLRG